METFSIAKTIHTNPPALPFKKIKEVVLGKEFEVSLVFVGEGRSQTLNKTFRKKDKPANILTFPLSKKSGEIYITPTLIKKEAQKLRSNWKKTLHRRKKSLMSLNFMQALKQKPLQKKLKVNA